MARTLMAVGLALVAMAATASAGSPGIRAAISQTGIDYFKSVAIPMIEQSFATVTLPDLSYDQLSFSGSISNIVCNNLVIGGAVAQLEAGSGLFLQLTGLGISCSADFTYRENIWPHIPNGSGSVDASASGSSAQLTVSMSDNNGLPNVAASGCSANVQINNIDFHAGLLGDLLNLLSGLFKGHLESSLNSEVCNVVNNYINNDANAILDKYTLTLPINAPAPYNIAEAVFTLTDTPTVAASYLSVDMTGEVVNTAHPTNPPYQAPNLPPFDAANANHMVQLFLSPWIVETGAYVFYQANLMSATISSSMIPASSPIKLNTSDFSVLAPLLYKEYPDMGMSIDLSVDGIPAMIAATNGLNVTMPLRFGFNVLSPKGTEPAFVLNCTLATALDASIDNTYPTSVVGQMRYLACPLEFVSSNVGAVQAGLLAGLIDVLIPSVALPAINKVLEKGFPLPVVQGLTFVNPELVFGSGYLLVATDVNFNPALSGVADRPYYDFDKLNARIAQLSQL